jgi:hypothetical protein
MPQTCYLLKRRCIAGGGGRAVCGVGAESREMDGKSDVK